MISLQQPFTNSARVLSGRIVVTGQPAHLDLLEQHCSTEGKVAQQLGVAITPASIHNTDNPPRIYAYDGQSWQTVVPQKPLKANARRSRSAEIAGEAELYTAFQKTQAVHTHTSRTFSFDVNSKKLVAEIAAKLNDLLNNQKELGDFRFAIAPDHVVRHTTGGHFPGDSPWRIPARSFKLDPVKHGTPRQAFMSQNCWEIIGASDRKNFPHQGEGVTVAILDTAPSCEKISHELVDYVITLNEPTGAFENPPTQAPSVDLEKLYEQNQVKPAKKERPGKGNINPARMEPYHGLLIASLIRELAPAATIILVQILDQTGEGSGSNTTEALEYIQFLREGKWSYNGKRLVEDKLVYNLSLGFTRSLAEEVDAHYLLNSCERLCKNGALIVAAAGNDSYYFHPRNPEEPAAYGYFCDERTVFENVIAVSATGPVSADYAIFSNQGNLSAPGMDLLMDSGDEQNPGRSRYVYWSGTSFATPLVAASAALLLSAGVPHNQVKQTLWQGSTPPNHWSEITRLNVAGALKLVPAEPQAAATPAPTEYQITL